MDRNPLARTPWCSLPMQRRRVGDGGCGSFGLKAEGGFTLLELMVVIVVIGLLAGLVAPRYFDTVGKSKANVARAQIDSLEKALDQYRLEVGSYPTQEQGLAALNAPPSGVTQWMGPYLKKPVPLDPWNSPYIYKLSPNGRDIDIVSLGSDGKPGGDGDAKDISLSTPQ